MLTALTAAPVWVSVAFQICETVCDPGQDQPTVHFDVATVPELVTVKPSWNPPLHELTSDQLTVQPADEPVELGEGEADGDDDCDGEALAEGDDEADADGLGEAECDGLADADGEGDVEGEMPVPLVSTTTDSAGIVSVPPVKVLCVIVGLAALYTYSVSELLVIPRLDVLTV